MGSLSWSNWKGLVSWSRKNLTPTSIKGSPKIVVGIAIWLQWLPFMDSLLVDLLEQNWNTSDLGVANRFSAGQSSWCHITWGHDLIINGWWMDDKWMMNEVGLHLTQNSKSIETNLLLVAFLPQQRSTWDGSSNDGRFLYMKPLSFSHVTSCFRALTPRSPLKNAGVSRNGKSIPTSFTSTSCCLETLNHVRQRFGKYSCNHLHPLSH